MNKSCSDQINDSSKWIILCGAVGVGQGTNRQMLLFHYQKVNKNTIKCWMKKTNCVIINQTLNLAADQHILNMFD